MNPERLMQMAISTVNKTPRLKECSGVSLLSALMTCSAVGLEPSEVDGLGRAWIIPYYNKKVNGYEARFQLGYRGMVDLMRRSGQVTSIAARPVYAGDSFEYEFGLNEDIKHFPTATERTADKLTHVYLIVHLKDDGRHIDVMTRAQIDAHRSRSQSPNSGPWVTDYEAMALKTIIRSNFRWLPASVESQSAVEADGTSGMYDIKTDKGDAIDIAPIDVQDIPEQPTEAPEEPLETEIYEGAIDPQRAVCKGCGTVVEVAPDATLEDFENVACKHCGGTEWSMGD
jgi:recombination protein RecT